MISLVIPTYNERQNIPELVERTGKSLAICGDSYELIIADDDSPDGTAQEVQRFQVGRPWLKLVVRKNERDLSTAVLAGWRGACGDILGCMDGDLQHRPEYLIKLLDRLRATDAELVIASRYVKQGGVSEWKFRRRIISWTASFLAELLLPGKLHNVRDPMSGFFMLKRSVIENVALRPLGYKILLEVLGRGVYHHIEEVPYTFEERAHGGSKMGLAQIWLYLLQLMRICYETGEAKQILKFLIGLATGILTNLVALVWLHTTLGLPLLASAFLAAEVGLLSNFISNELLRWSERTGLRLSCPRRFLRFHWLTAAALLVNSLGVWLAAGVLGRWLLSAGLGGAVAASLLSFFVNAHSVWTANHVTGAAVSVRRRTIVAAAGPADQRDRHLGDSPRESGS